MLESRQPAHLTNCEIKRSRQGDKLEILLKKFTEISKSPKKIDIPEQQVAPDSPSIITLGQLHDIQDFQRVSVDIKVVDIHEPIQVTGGKCKQDMTVSDSTATARLTLWEEKVNSMDEDISYSLQNVVVRQYRGKKYLSLGKTGSTIEEIKDIGEVVDYNIDSDIEDAGRELRNATIIGVVSLTSYVSCLGCKARVESTSPPLGRCTKCSMMQRMDKCNEQLSAKVVIEQQVRTDFQHNTTYSVFGNLLYRMCLVSTAGEVTQEALLSAPPFHTVTYNANNVITGITRGTESDSMK